jgi:hypothetical protein
MPTSNIQHQTCFGFANGHLALALSLSVARASLRALGGHWEEQRTTDTDTDTDEQQQHTVFTSCGLRSGVWGLGSGCCCCCCQHCLLLLLLRYLVSLSAGWGWPHGNGNTAPPPVPQGRKSGPWPARRRLLAPPPEWLMEWAWASGAPLSFPVVFPAANLRGIVRMAPGPTATRRAKSHAASASRPSARGALRSPSPPACSALLGTALRSHGGAGPTGAAWVS